MLGMAWVRIPGLAASRAALKSVQGPSNEQELVGASYQWP